MLYCSVTPLCFGTKVQHALRESGATKRILIVCYEKVNEHK